MTGLFPYLVSRLALLASTSKDPSIGDVPPVLSAKDLSPRLHGKSCLVVGGTRGIGRGIALTLARAGASVAVVGRDVRSIVGELQGVAPIHGTDTAFNGPSQQRITAHAADLYTVSGANALVEALSKDDHLRQQPFDCVFFTVGCWPDYSDPFTSDGIEKTVALDLVARHTVLTSLIRQKMLRRDGRVVSTLASAQQFPFQSVAGVRARLREATELVPPGRVPFCLMPVALAGDAWLREGARRYNNNKKKSSTHSKDGMDLHFVGMFPGTVNTEVANTSFPSWMVPMLRAKMWLVGSTEEEAGLAHVTVLMSDNVARQGICFYNHLLEARRAHAVAMDDDLAEYVFDWLEETCAAHSGSGDDQ